MKICFLISTVLLLISCSQKVEKKTEPFTSLSFLASDDTLHLCFRNDRCGEWGGDTRNIYVYKEYDKGKNTLFVDVNESKMDCDSIEKYLDRPVEKAFEKKKIKVDQQKLNLISETIEELINLQMNFDAGKGVSNSGRFSGMRTSNKKLSLHIYPSPDWPAFEQLFKTLKINN